MPHARSSRLYALGLALAVTLALGLPAQAQTGGELFTTEPAPRSVTLTGYTRARWTMDIAPEVSGLCLRVGADVGEPIGKGGVFVQLDTTFIDLALKKNKAAQDKLANSQAYYQRVVDRYQALVTSDNAARSVLDEWRNHRDQAALEIESLRVEAAELTEQRVRHAVRVPANWLVTERLVEPGEWVQAGTVIGRAGYYGRLLVPFALDPAEYAWLKSRKDQIILNFPDLGVNVPASLERVSPAFDPQTRKTSVDLLVSGGLPEMRGGLRAELAIELPDADAVLVPAAAVGQRYEEAYLTREDGSRLKVLVLGDGPDGRLRVRAAGLRPGERFRTAAE
jgi:RND family efflux transporter MFP subunit